MFTHHCFRDFACCAAAAGALPALGQAAQGVSAGLGQLPGFLGTAGTLRGAVQRLGVKGLDAGIGCGVGVGYGFGAGLMLKPGALEAAGHALQTAAGAETAGCARVTRSSSSTVHL